MFVGGVRPQPTLEVPIKDPPADHLPLQKANQTSPLGEIARDVLRSAWSLEEAKRLYVRVQQPQGT